MTDWNGRNATFSYDNVGRRIGLSLPNGTKTTYSYDSSGRFTNLLTQNSQLQTRQRSLVMILWAIDLQDLKTKITTPMDGCQVHRKKSGKG